MDVRTFLLAAAQDPAVVMHCRQTLDGSRLCQSVELHRPGGTIWEAYARAIQLPAEAGPRARLLLDATVVLDLAAGAVAAADTARQARGFAVDQLTLAAQSYDRHLPPAARG